MDATTYFIQDRALSLSYDYTLASLAVRGESLPRTDEERRSSTRQAPTREAAHA